MQQVEALRAQELSKTSVEAEIAVRKSQGVADALIREAEGKSSAKKIEADAFANSIKIKGEAQAMVTKMTADAEAESIKLKALADFVKKQNEARGILELREAESIGLKRLLESAGNTESLNQYLLVRDSVLPQLAHAQAAALKDMKPNVNIWQTGGDVGSGNAYTNTIADLLKTGIPLLDGVKSQTGIDFLKNFKDDKKPASTKQV